MNLTEREQEIQRLKAELQQACGEASKNLVEAAMEQKRADTLQKENKQLREELNRLNDAFRTANRHNLERHTEVRKLREEREKDKAEIAALHRVIVATEQQWKEWEARAIQAEQDAAILKENYDAMKRSCEGWENAAIQAEQERDKFERLFEGEMNLRHEWMDIATEAKEERDALLEGMKWYADTEAYVLPHVGCSAKVMADKGERARSILTKIGQT